MPGTPSRRLDLLALGLLLVAAAWLHAPVLQGDFVYDDRLLVLANPVVTDASHWREMFTSGMWDFADAETARAVGYWRPVAVGLLRLSWVAGDGDPWTFHLVSLALHLAAIAACWRCARALSRSSTVALVAAALWAFHPTHVESVAWISAIGDPAFGLCAFLMLAAWVRAREAGRTPWQAGAWFALALFCKEMALALVPLVALVECAPGRERLASLAAPGTRLRVGLALLAPLALWYGGRALAFGEWSAGLARTTTGFGVPDARLWLLRLELLGGGTQLAWWPHPLVLFRSFTPAFDWSKAWMPLVALASSGLLAWWCWRKDARLAACAALFAPAALVPLVGRVESLGIFPLSDRYLYLASFGPALLAGLAAARLGRVAVVAAFVLCAPLAFISRERIAAWRDEETLLRQAASESPRAPYAQWQLGRVLLERHKRDGDARALFEAKARFEAALDLLAAAKRGDDTIFGSGEDHLQANSGYAWALLFEADIDGYNDYETPAGIFQSVVERLPGAEEAWTGLGVARTLSGELDKAREAFEMALRANPLHPEAHEDLGVLLARMGDFDAARRSFAEALRLDPSSVRARLRLAGMHERAGDAAEALRQVEAARAAHPRDPRPCVARAQLLAAAGRMDEALADADRAIALDGDHGAAHLSRARILAARGERNGALLSARRACDLLPTSFDAHYLAGALLLQLEGPVQAAPYLVRAWTRRARQAAVEVQLEAALDELPFASATSLLELARADADRMDDRRATKWGQRAKLAFPGDAEVARTLAEVHRRFGRAEAALAEWSRAAALAPEDPHASEACARLQLDLGDREAARRSLQEALARAQAMRGDARERRSTIERIEMGLARLAP
ncbi:MAG: tetratricopeptide repeat protein [Planctomycetia bacterium]